MKTYKHNQRVKCTITGRDITDAKISIDGDGLLFICQNYKDGVEAMNKLGYKYSWELNSDFIDSGVTNLRPALKSFDDPQVGDEYKDTEGHSQWVLGVAGRVIVSSVTDNKDLPGLGYTKEELIRLGYTIVQDDEEPEDEVEEITLEAVCKELGREVKIKK